MNTAEQCRQMGLQVGDTIIGRETYSKRKWSESRLTLLWLGKEIAVWREQHRSNLGPEWTEEGESAAWTLDCRRWAKVKP